MMCMMNLAPASTETPLEAHAGNRPFFLMVSHDAVHVDHAASTNVVFQRNALGGRVYTVYGTTNLMESFNRWVTNIVHPKNTFADSLHSASDSAFHKIEA